MEVVGEERERERKSVCERGTRRRQRWTADGGGSHASGCCFVGCDWGSRYVRAANYRSQQAQYSIAQEALTSKQPIIIVY